MNAYIAPSIVQRKSGARIEAVDLRFRACFVVSRCDRRRIPADQRDLMEWPFFTLVKAKRTTPILYEAGDTRLEVFAVPRARHGDHLGRGLW
jgi:hypothetical protein